MSSSQYRDTLHTTFTRGGITGHGEGAPIVRYHEDAASAQKAVESVRDLLLSADPMQFAKIMAEVFKRVPGEWAGKAAIDIALMDWVGKKLGIPLYSYFGLDPKDAPLTTFSIGIDTPEITKQKTLEAADYPVLKVKVGLATDEPTIEAVRSVTKKPLRVDANEGWKDKEEAVRKINWLEKMGVEFIEQPMPAEMLEETRWVRSKVHIPVIADEACQHAADIPKLRECFDGVNVKLDKSGGMLEAYRMLQIAKSLGMKTMLGCMISSHNLEYETFESASTCGLHRVRPALRRWCGDFGNPHGHPDCGSSRFLHRRRRRPRYHTAANHSNPQDAGVSNLSLSGTSLNQNYDYSTNPPTIQTLVVYQFTFSVPAGGLKDAAKIMETLRTKSSDLLKGFQYTASLNASQATVDAMRQTLLPQLISDAQKKAQTLAAAASPKLGAVKGVSDSYYASGYSSSNWIGTSSFQGSFNSNASGSGTQYTFNANVTFSATQ